MVSGLVVMASCIGGFQGGGSKRSPGEGYGSAVTGGSPRPSEVNLTVWANSMKQWWLAQVVPRGVSEKAGASFA